MNYNRELPGAAKGVLRSIRDYPRGLLRDAKKEDPFDRLDLIVYGAVGAGILFSGGIFALYRLASELPK